MSLPDESYYREEQFASVRDAYVTHVQRMLDLAGIGDSEERAKRIFDLETEIARTHWDKVTSRDSEKTYNPRTWAEASNSSARVSTCGRGVDGPEHAFDEVVLRQPSFTEGLAALFVESRVPTRGKTG